MGKPKTNFDRIKRMTIEEMVSFMEKLEEQDIDFGITFCGDECDMKFDCNTCRLTWLKRDYEPNGFWSRDISTEEERSDNW